MNNWPFKYVNGEQTQESKDLEANKKAHKEPDFDLENAEEALF